MVSSRKVSCIVFFMHVEYLCNVHVLVGVNVSVIMCILVWIHVQVCVAPPIVVVRGRWRGCYGGPLSIIIHVLTWC